MKRMQAVFGTLVLGACAWMGVARAADAPAAPAKAEVRRLNVEAKPWTGDFDAMLARRTIRVAVPYSRTLYFNDKGRERGITADHVRDFERYLNKKYAKQLGKRPLTIYLVPTTRDELLSDLTAGLADIAAGNLTVTPEREKIVDFYAPADQKLMSEVVVTSAKAPPLAAAEDLSGRTVHVRKASSYYDSLLALNERLKAAGKRPVELVIVPDALEDEDLMEMVNAGVIGAIVVDDWKARAWAQVLPNLRVDEGAVLRSGGRGGWAMRKGSPKLHAEIEQYYLDQVKKNNLVAVRQKQYASRIKQMKDPTKTADWQRFEQTIELFKKYGARYGFDPLMLAAQGYQESTLDQNAKSHVGAIGIMQVMPATGAELAVGDIRVAEANVHAGAKYMDKLMSQYFKDANFNPTNRALFAFASYNAGPGRISSLRKEAVKRGLDPDKWFNNVELVTAEKVGIETTTYVRNIYKYYVAYTLTLDLQEQARKARAAVPGAAAKP
jgi:membrane-bound lytic murein transglycosylase MltF